MNGGIPDDGRFYGHSRNPAGYPQTMAEHASEVARRAAIHATPFGESEKALLAGLLHDLGKYTEAFQNRLKGLGSGLDHWSLGADVAYRKFLHFDVALSIWGHHIGLQKLTGLSHLLVSEHPMGLCLTETNSDMPLKRLEADGLSLPRLKGNPRSLPVTASAMLDTRMLFSCLVDADFLDTEAHMTKGKPDHTPRPEPPRLNALKALQQLEIELTRLNADMDVPESTRRLRTGLADLCQQKGRNIHSRLWTLTAPTGTGKTLAMLRFALERAVHDSRIRRIVVVLPYLSILDQTVDTYRNLFPESEFGKHYILEHHSLTCGPQGKDDEQDETAREARLLTQNWDSPIVITTSVQFLESLFANRTSACRKLHHLAGSVILMDEVQTLPLPIAVPTLQTLSRLTVEKYGVTVLFATATQPAFESLKHAVQESENAGWTPEEVVDDTVSLYNRARRVAVNWKPVRSSNDWETVAGWLESSPRSLCIVNLKRHALELVEQLKKTRKTNVWHLSTSMCPDHRRAVLKRVTSDLRSRKTCRLISTQCVEAGVDLSFPKVFRALGPLDSIAQAAGRCNRSAELETMGEVVVFRPKDERYPPDLVYQTAAQVTANLLNDPSIKIDINDPHLYTRYYKRLYALTDVENQGQELREAIKAQDYVRVAELYRVIKNDTVNVVVPYNSEALAIIDEVKANGLTADWVRRARPFTVSVFRTANGVMPSHLSSIEMFLRKTGNREPVADWFYLDKDMSRYYHPEFGLIDDASGAFFG